MRAGPSGHQTSMPTLGTPASTLTVKFGQTRWYWASSRPAARVVGACPVAVQDGRAHVRPLRARPVPGGEAVLVGIDVEELQRSRGARSGSGSTRGSSRSRPSSWSAGPTPSALRTRARRGRTRSRRPRPERPRACLRAEPASRSGFTNTKWPPGVDLDPVERQLFDRQVGLALPAGDGSQAAVEAVRPGVVGALERPPVALAGHDLVAAVAADVHEAAQLTLLVPDDGHGYVSRARGEEVAGFRHLVGPSDVLPRACEDALCSSARMASSVYHEAGSVQPVGQAVGNTGTLIRCEGPHAHRCILALPAGECPKWQYYCPYGK